MQIFSKLNHLSAGIAIFFAAFLLSSCGSKETQQAATTVHNVYLTSPQPIGGSVAAEYSAVVEEARNISVGFKTGGQIEKVMVKEGDYVKAGQVLATLDSRDYALAVEQLKIQYEQLKSEFSRKEQLFASGNISPNDFEKAKAGLEQLRVQLELNTNKLSYTRLHAPVSGYITKRNHERGETVGAGTSVVELMDDGNLEVIVDLPAAEYARRNSFAGFTGRLTNSQSSFPLTYLSLTPKADNNQLYQLRLAVPAASRKALTAGMNLNVAISHSDSATAEGAESNAGSYSLPLRSVFTDAGKEYVWIFNPADSTVNRRQVTTSGNAGDGLISVSGVTTTDRIVRAGVNVLQEGEKVVVLEEASATNKGELL
jgi:RND family efflux transporter MFP subunit